MTQPLLIVKPIPFAAVTDANANGSGTVPNAQSPDPKEPVVASSVVGVVNVRADLGAVYSIDSFYAGYLTQILQIDISTGTVSPPPTYRGTITYASPEVSPAYRQHGWLRLGAPVNARYIDFAISRSGSGIDGTVGILAAGLGFQPLYGREWGSGRVPLDMSATQELRGGGFSIDRGARKAGFQFTCGDLTDAETAVLWNQALDLGSSGPVIVIEDPDTAIAGLNDRIHYGIFDRPQSYERRAVGVNSFSFLLREWV